MSHRYTYEGSCHCHNLEVRLASDKTPLDLGTRADGCSFCKRHRAVYTVDPAGSLSIIVRDASLLSRYRFGTRTADFLLCKSCGAFVAAHMPEASIAVVNVNVLEASAAFLATPLRLGDFDQESVQERLARRKAGWSARVNERSIPMAWCIAKGPGCSSASAIRRRRFGGSASTASSSSRWRRGRGRPTSRCPRSFRCRSRA